jgi:NAD(P)-dependent dehydrogenase (short-subunit alcohol dehydrogenase family)
MHIADCVFLVTGAGSGLGLASARELVGQGGRVVLLDINAEAGRAAADALGANARFIQADITREDEGRAAVAMALDVFGGLHGLVNCAGIAPAEKVLGRNGVHGLDSFRRTIEINLIGSFNLLRLAAEAMALNAPNAERERGVIVNTASVAAFDGQIGTCSCRAASVHYLRRSAFSSEPTLIKHCFCL